MNLERKYSNTCRICLSTNNDKLLSLFENYRTSLVFDYVTDIAKVNIKPDDGLPDKICSSCLLDLDTALNFKEKCEASDVTLRQIPKAVLNEETIVQFGLKKEEAEVNFFDSNDVYSECEEEIFTCTENKKAIKQVRSNQPQCADCDQFFKSKCKLRVHWKKEHKPKSFTCQSCKRLFKSYTAYNKHVNTYQKGCIEIGNGDDIRIEGEGKNRIFYCSHCDYKSNRIIHIRAHLVVHSRLRPFKCDLCSKAYTQRGPLILHKSVEHSETKVSAECHVCGKLFSTKRHLYRHLLTHTNERYKCDICNTILKNKKYLQIHMIRHSGMKNFTCEICAATFYTTAELCNHKRTHKAKEWLFKCNICEYRTTTKTLLKKHMARHTGNKPYSCGTCGRFFDSEQSLNIHERRHDEDKKFVCPMCPRMFYRKRSISRHVIQKHNSKMLKCGMADGILSLKEEIVVTPD